MIYVWGFYKLSEKKKFYLCLPKELNKDKTFLSHLNFVRKICTEKKLQVITSYTALPRKDSAFHIIQSIWKQHACTRKHRAHSKKFCERTINPEALEVRKEKWDWCMTNSMTIKKPNVLFCNILSLEIHKF